MPQWTDVVTVLTAELGEDEYGTPDTERDWENATPTDIHGVSCKPVAGTELLEDRDAVITRRILRVPLELGSAITTDNHIKYRDKTYEVEGDVEVWDADSDKAHVKMLLKKVIG